jgi:hypothetical protein
VYGFPDRVEADPTDQFRPAVPFGASRHRSTPLRRLWQRVLLAALGPLCWLGMQAVHEFGHVLGARLSGGTVERVVLHPLTISRTDLGRNPHPQFVAWAGPAGGVLLPLVAWGLARAAGLPGTYLLRFFAGFCCLANGAYLGVGVFDRVGDAGDLLRHGTAPWELGLFGAGTAPLGLWLWHGQGPHFGLGQAAAPVRPAAAWAVLGLLVGVVLLELWLGGE